MGPRRSNRSLATPTWLGAAVGLGLLSGCGGGVPLLHPAHVLPAGRTAFAVGVSDRFLLGDTRHAFEAGMQPPPPGAPPQKDLRAARGTLVALAEGPAVAAFAAARVGVPGSNEAGLSYSGQAVRGDFRHAFDWGAYALSTGLGVTGRFGHSSADLPPNADLSGAHGLGLDLPVLFGYRTDAEVISVWGGVRGSFDHWSGTVSLDPDPAFDLGARRWSVGPIVGMSLGLPPFWVSAEIEIDYANVSGSLERPGTRYDANIDGWSARPAGAVTAKF
ncbi:MAG TPA: hypothetical protein VHM25_23245 [Polyangiaceae bacterium]|nr:hypothetical protein [Polyangiaceae bacterium]